MVDLLDARGCEVILNIEDGHELTLKFLGAVVPQHEEAVYDEDQYAVAHVRDQGISGTYKVVVKDTGISASGLRLCLINNGDSSCNVDVSLAGEQQPAIVVEAGSTYETTYDTLKLCTEEREYLKNLQGILYKTITEVDRVCTKHNINYYVVFGGLLGVYRYGEIIPWDDDLDIAMTREDYEKFQKVAPGEFSSDYMLLDYKDIGKDKPCFLDYMCRVLYMGEEVPGNVFKKVSGKCREDILGHQPLDIYILDKTSDDLKKHKRHMFWVRAVYGLAMSKRAYLDKREYAGRDKLTRVAVPLLYALGKLLPARVIFALHDKICTKYQKTDAKEYFFSNGYLPFIHTRYSKEWFQGGERVDFGPTQINIPNQYEAYLKRAYYDYYHLRGMNGRIPQHSPKNHGVI